MGRPDGFNSIKKDLVFKKLIKEILGISEGTTRECAVAMFYVRVYEGLGQIIGRALVMFTSLNLSNEFVLGESVSGA